MLRYFLPLVAVPLCLGAWCASPTMADTPAQARSQIQAIYNKQNAAAARKDVNGVLSNLAPNFQAISKNGQKLDVARQRQALTQAFAMAQSVHGTTVIQKLRLQGNKAIVTVKDNSSLVFVNPNAPNARPAKFSAEEVAEDTWVKTGNRWLQERSVALSEKQLLNGQPFRMPQRPAKQRP